MPVCAPTRRQLLALALPAMAASSAKALEAGAPAPTLKLGGLSGVVDLAALSGLLVYVDFWASWCAPCRQSFPWMNDLQVRHHAQGLRVVAVKVDTRRADAERFLAANPARFVIAFDDQGDTPRRWEITTMPSSALVGRDGRLLWMHRGFRHADRRDLDARVLAALGAR